MEILLLKKINNKEPGNGNGTISSEMIKSSDDLILTKLEKLFNKMLKQVTIRIGITLPNSLDKLF